jgi:hypothetical protein
MNDNEIHTLKECLCGRSPTGSCIGWHALSEDDFRQHLAEYDSTQVKAFENKNTPEQD